MLSLVQIIVRLILAVFLGSMVGLERERHDKAAGLRTHMLVCVGSTLIMIVSAYGFNDLLGRQATVLDPSRVAAQVVSGIGFLGAGLIIFRRDVVIGLTTAAGVWAVAGVGLAVGGGLYIPAIITTVIIVLVMEAIIPIETRLRKSHKQILSLTVLVDRDTSMSVLEDAVRTENAVFKGLRVEPEEDAGRSRNVVLKGRVESGEKSRYDIVDIMLEPLSTSQALAIVDQLKKMPSIHRVEIGN